MEHSPSQLPSVEQAGHEDNIVIPAPYRAPLLLYIFSGLVVALAGGLASAMLVPGLCTGHEFGFQRWFSNWDGQWYNVILQNGYKVNQGNGGYSSQVFFPLYPILGTLIRQLTGLDGEYSLLVAAWLSALGLCIAWVHYAESHPRLISRYGSTLGLAALLFWPCAYFLRVDYSEAPYMLLLALFFTGLHRQWAFWKLILVCGLLTAARPTGFLCIAVLALHAWNRMEEVPFFARACRLGLISFSAGWGLWLYMLYQYIFFDEAFIFYRDQIAWNYGKDRWVFFQQWQDMLLLKPWWIAFANGDVFIAPLFPEILQNRISFALAAVLIWVGVRRKYLTPEELLYCCLSMALFYYYKAPHNMEAMGRYVFSILPIYLVIARLLQPLPEAAALGVISLSAVFLFLHTAMFAQMYCMY